MKLLKRLFWIYLIGFLLSFLAVDAFFKANNDYNELESAFLIAVIWPITVPLALLFWLCAL